MHKPAVLAKRIALGNFNPPQGRNFTPAEFERKERVAICINWRQWSVMLQLTATLIVFLFPLAYSPGPGNLFFAANGARFGFSKTLAANLGYHAATFVVTVAIGFGFGWVATEFPLFLTVIKYAGSVYVLFLAWGLFRAGAVDSEMKAKHADFLDGAILLVLNPKAYLIIVLMFTQFTASSQQVQIGLVLLVSTVFTLNNAVAFSLWAFAGDRLALAFRDDGNARRLNVVFGCVLMMVAIWMLTS